MFGESSKLSCLSFFIVFESLPSLSAHQYCYNMSIKILSANCQGLGSLEKRLDVLNYLKDKKCDIQSKLFIMSLVITEYSLSDIKLLGTDLFQLKFPLYNRIFT